VSAVVVVVVVVVVRPPPLPVFAFEQGRSSLAQFPQRPGRSSHLTYNSEVSRRYVVDKKKKFPRARSTDLARTTRAATCGPGKYSVTCLKKPNAYGQAISYSSCFCFAVTYNLHSALTRSRALFGLRGRHGRLLADTRARRGSSATHHRSNAILSCPREDKVMSPLGFQVTV
jgi:hypothetical protein